MLERLSLVNIMARQQAFTTGQFTCAPYEALLQVRAMPRYFHTGCKIHVECLS